MLNLVITLLDMPPVHDAPYFCKSENISVRRHTKTESAGTYCQWRYHIVTLKSYTSKVLR